MRRMKLMLSALLVALCIAGNVMAEEVVITARGKKYHKPTCRIMQNKEVKTMEKEAAIEKGLTGCKLCYKEDVVIEVEAEEEK